MVKPSLQIMEVNSSMPAHEFVGAQSSVDAPPTNKDGFGTPRRTSSISKDSNSIFSSFNSNIGKQCQVLAIIGDNSEEFDENNNPVLNPANIDRGANHLAEGETAESLATRENF
jgi:hypothetical protein